MLGVTPNKISDTGRVIDTQVTNALAHQPNMSQDQYLIIFQDVWSYPPSQSQAPFLRQVYKRYATRRSCYSDATESLHTYLEFCFQELTWSRSSFT